MTLINPVQEFDLVLSIDRTFKCSRARLWRAWTNAAEIAQWFGPEGCTAPGAVADVRVGGRYSFPIIGQDGSLNTVVGEYTHVEEPAHLAFTWSWIREDGRPG